MFNFRTILQSTVLTLSCVSCPACYRSIPSMVLTTALTMTTMTMMKIMWTTPSLTIEWYVSLSISSSLTVKTRRLSLFGHIARMNESTDASRILFEPPSEVWTKPRGRPRNSWIRTVTNDLANSYTGLPEARENAQDRVYWRMFTKHSATHS